MSKFLTGVKALGIFIGGIVGAVLIFITILDTNGEIYTPLVMTKIFTLFAVFGLGIIFGFKEDDGR